MSVTGTNFRRFGTNYRRTETEYDIMTSTVYRRMSHSAGSKKLFENPYDLKVREQLLSKDNCELDTKLEMSCFEKKEFDEQL